MFGFIPDTSLKLHTIASKGFVTQITNDDGENFLIAFPISFMIEKFVSNDTYKNKIIFDGYPRTLIQANNLDDLLKKYKQKIDIVLKLSVSLQTIKKRISERRSQEKRPDDNEEIAAKRYETYEKSTEPIIEYYKKLNLLKVVDGERPIHQINTEISDIISLI